MAEEENTQWKMNATLATLSFIDECNTLLGLNCKWSALKIVPLSDC